ncbi:hypothetical protein C8R46DRAFT_1195983 [Mycena filopes]|nr:hypothetical protein C8R46DRAFT_1195983 [Mycena filopes]
MSDAAVEKVIMDWFGRAGTCPLTFSVRMRKGWGVFNRTISSVLLALRPRLQSVCLQLKREHFERLAGIGPFPILEDLAIGIPWSQFDGSMKIFCSAPALRRVFFSEHAKPSMFILPHKNISQVICQTLLRDHFLDFLQNYPLVKEFTGLVGDTSRTKFITHTHLESLCLASESGTAFLRLLQLPALRQLTLSTDLEDVDGYHDDDINLDYLIPFLASTSLRSFCATHRIIGLSLDLFTTGMRRLADIDLCDPQQPFLSQFFAKLDRTKDDAFLPQLRALVFRKCDVSLDPAMLQALSSRCTANDGLAVLESFQLIWPGWEEPDADSDYHSDSDSASPRDDPRFVDDATISACRGMVKRGMSIHVGLAGRNWVL